MKLSLKKYKNRVGILALFFGTTLLFFSCAKEFGNGETGNGKLKVKVLGVTDMNDISKSAFTASVQSNAKPSKTNSTENDLIAFDAFDALVTVEKDQIKKSRVSIGEGVQGVSSGLMAAAVAPGVKYRLLLYKEDGTFVSSTALVSGQEGEVSVTKGFKYNYYAISYNTEEDVVGINTGNATLAIPEGHDVIHANGSIDIPLTASDANIPLGIVFKHKFARIGLELNTMGMFADIQSAGVSVSGLALKTGTIDLKNGNLSNLQNYTKTLSYSDFTNVNPDYSDAKIAYAYTADATALSSFTVSVNALSLTLDNASTRTFGNLATSPSVFTFSNVTPVLGGSFTARVNLIESPITVAGVKWARTNVYENGGHNPYRFSHTYAHTNQLNSYFSFKGEKARMYGNNGDPCALVYPEGVWRQASELDFRKLVGGRPGGGLLGTNYPAQPFTRGTEGALNFIEYAGAGLGTPSYPSNRLRFNMNGLGISIGAVLALITIDLGSTYGNSLNVWTSTDVSLLPPLVGIGAWYHDATAAISPRNVTDLDVSLLNLGLIETSFRNVRCVRR
ncbi:hypothetical protein [Sphingobacterium hungaricum]|uniref:Fimbrillin-like n=1 Tax=Sphingobacterium hungaricum TaxID=2082723 RepID=A0A928UVR7_9SPHI|nr:hypothetical protein [Sphingobacterium hungaricum]MBE8713843.1 hypothetical protein [Sphingobacterium hungaricum]